VYKRLKHRHVHTYIILYVQEGGDVSALAVNHTDNELVTAGSLAFQLQHWKFDLKQLLQKTLDKDTPAEPAPQVTSANTDGTGVEDEQGASARPSDSDKLEAFRTWKVC
jgi:hypothetical protein